MDKLALVLSNIKYREEKEEKLYFETVEEFYNYVDTIEG